MLVCAQCSAPLSGEAVQGRAPCGKCGAMTGPAVNPFGPEAFAAAAPVAHARVCPACRLENGPNIKFCRGCGSLLSLAAPAPQMFSQGSMVSGGPAPVAQAWPCPSCRHENQAHHAFCLGCGEARRGGVPIERGGGYDANAVYAQPRTAAVPVVVVGAILLVAVIAAGIALILIR